MGSEMCIRDRPHYLQYLDKLETYWCHCDNLRVRKHHSSCSNYGNANEGEQGAKKLVSFSFHVEDDDGEDESGDDGASSHHLVDRTSCEVEGEELQVGGEAVATGGKGQPEFIELYLFTFSLGLLLSLSVGERVVPAEEVEERKCQNLSQKHGGHLIYYRWYLHEGVEEIFVDASFIDELFVLGLVD